MIIECENCSTQFETDVAFPPEGRKVRCARCSHIWIAHPFEETGADEATVDEIGSEELPETEETDEELDSEVSADVKNDDVLSDLEPPSIQPLVPDLESLADLEFSEVDGEEEHSQEDIDALFSADSEEPAGQEASEEETAENVDDPMSSDPDDMPVEAMPDSDDDLPAKDISADDVSRDDLAVAESLADDSSEIVAEDDQNQDISTADDEALDDTSSEVEPASLLFEKLDGAGDRPKPPDVVALSTGWRTRLIAGWGGLASFVIILTALAYFFRVDIVRVLPGSAGLYAGLGIPVNIRGLEIRDVTFNWETDSGTPILFVHGVIQNVTNRHVRIPTVVFAFQDNRGEELYHWAERVKTQTLPAGKQVTFATRVPSPPKAVENLQVRFAKPR
ncbi:MAG: zinc-ribbon domain-containing protein [Methyloligellaceae bacterium]